MQTNRNLYFSFLLVALAAMPICPCVWAEYGNVFPAKLLPLAAHFDTDKDKNKQVQTPKEDATALELKPTMQAGNIEENVELTSSDFDLDTSIKAHALEATENTASNQIDTEDDTANHTIAEPVDTSSINLHRIVSVIIRSSLNSQSVYVGDPVVAKLKDNLYFGRRLIAAQNSALKGHVISCRSARTLGDAAFGDKDKLKSNGAVGIRFEELITDQGQSIFLSGLPVHQESFRMDGEGYTSGISVDNQGVIVQAGRTLSKEQKDSYNVLRVATSAPVPGGIFLNLACAPVVMGAVGAANPEMAFNKQLDHNINHKRLKGMAYGFVTNLPGAFFIQSLVQKGNEISLSDGDELLIDLIINGQPNSIVQQIASFEAFSIKGQVLDAKSNWGSANEGRRLFPSTSND